MKPFMIVDGRPMEAVEVLEGIVKFFRSNQVHVAENDDVIVIGMKKDDWDNLSVILALAEEAQEVLDDEDKAKLIEIARKGLSRPSTDTRIGRQLIKFTEP